MKQRNDKECTACQLAGHIELAPGVTENNTTTLVNGQFLHPSRDAGKPCQKAFIITAQETFLESSPYGTWLPWCRAAFAVIARALASLPHTGQHCATFQKTMEDEEDGMALLSRTFSYAP